MDKEAKEIVLVVGCSKGIGLGTIKSLAEENFIVYAATADPAGAEELTMLKESYSNLEIVKFDLKDNSVVEKTIESIIEKNGKIDVVIYNAGYILFGPIETAGIDQIKDVFEVNVFGAIRVTQAVLPYMRNEGSGKIIFLGSTSGIRSSGMYGYYSATKFSIESIAHALAVNMSPWNIDVVLIENTATSTTLATKGLQLGNKLTEMKNPYKKVVEKSLEFLTNVLSSGHSIEKVAKTIVEVVKAEKPKFRYFVSTKAKAIFESQLKDPTGEDWLAEEKKMYSDWL